MKRLICCLDGTWNNDDEGSVLTNVAKLQRCIAPMDASGVAQLAHYVPGIASAADTRAQFLKGAFGFEVDDRIKSGYRFLAENYQAGDEIFLFGFSRGAFQARSLAGFITLFGVARNGSDFSAEDAWEIYRRKPHERDGARLAALRASCHFPVGIKCVGVWDTVGNIGNPFFSEGMINRRFDFHDTRLHDSIEVGLHALSIDEMRGPFRPSLWTRPSNQPPPPGQHVEQVWFAGSHADVGGGFAETELSDIALLWMVERASSKAGLAFDQALLQQSTRPDPLGLQHSSATGPIFSWSGRLPFIRLINQNKEGISPLRRALIGGWRASSIKRGHVTVNEGLHESVAARYGRDVREMHGKELSEITYRPRNLTALMVERQKAALKAGGTLPGAGARTAEAAAETATEAAAIIPAGQSEGTKMTEAAASAPAAGTTKLVTVHGTGAGATQRQGERWWQLGSPFQVELAKRLDLDPARIEIVPFQWALGPNSEDGRRAAGASLCEKLQAYDRAGEDYHLIGHSHGGSVIYNALLHSVSAKKPLERLKSWSTVGTPFLDYRPNRFLFSRLGITGLTVYATALGAILTAFGLVMMYLFAATPFWQTVNATLGEHAFTNFYLPFIFLAVIYAASCIGFLYVLERWRGKWHSQQVKQQVANLYADRWIGLWHQDDEAISALSNVKNVKGPIVPSTFLVPFFGLTPLLLTVLAGAYLSNYFLTSAEPASPGMITALEELRLELDTGTSQGSWYFSPGFVATFLSLMAGIVTIYITVTLVIVAFLKFLAGWIGWPIAKMIDGLVWSSVRTQAWGDDRRAEAVHQIGSQPPGFSKHFAPLPSAIADKLSEHSERHAILTLKKVREVLGMTREPQASPDMRTELAKQLNWRELIHTSYFDIDEFISLTAFGLHKAGLANMKPEGADGTSMERLSAWYGEIAGTQSQRADMADTTTQPT